MTRFSLLLSAVLFFTPTLTLAQTPPPPQQGQQPPAPLTDQALQQQIEQNLLTARPAKDKTPLKQEVTPLDLNFSEIKGLPEDVTTKDVTIKGYTRYVEVDGKKIGQLVLTGLERDGEAADLDPLKFTSQFDLDGEELSKEANLRVAGDRKELIAALRKLDKKDKPQEEPQQQQQPQQARQSGRSGGVSSNAGQNQQAKNYQTPKRQAAQKDDPKESYRTTTEGCKVRVDLATEQAHQQSRVEKFVDGALQEAGKCADSGTAFPLNKNTQSCKPKIELTKRRVTSRFEWFYVDAQAKYQKASDCKSDKDKVFKIVEKDNSCPIDINLATKKATPQSKLIYVGINNTEEQVRDCAPSAAKPAVDMVQSTQSCKLTHDTSKGVTRELGVWTYKLDGVIYQATPCMDTGRTFTHKKVYKKGTQDICTPLVDLKKGTVALQSRTEITVDGVARYINECTPDKGAALKVKSTTDGCTDPALFRHNIGAGQSLGMRRYYYENPDRVYVTQCQSALDLVYPHKQTVVGWQNNDSDLTAQPLTKVTISIDGIDYEIVRSAVLAGAKKTPYTLARTETQIINTDYQGCSAIHHRAKVEIYTRPDQTEYSQRVGTAKAGAPVNACSKLVKKPVWKVVGHPRYTEPLLMWNANGPKAGQLKSRYPETASLPSKGWKSSSYYSVPYRSRERVSKTCSYTRQRDGGDDAGDYYTVTYDCSYYTTVYRTHYRATAYNRYCYYEGTRTLQRLDGSEIVQKAKSKNAGVCASTRSPNNQKPNFNVKPNLNPLFGPGTVPWDTAEGWYDASLSNPYETYVPKKSGGAK